MSNADFKELLNRYLNDSLSVEELQELFAHLQHEENTEALQQTIQQALQDNTFRQLADKSRTDILFHKLMQEARKEPLPRRKLFIMLPWLAAAAVMAGVFLVGYIVFIKDKPAKQVAVSEKKQSPADITPGANKAFLQLADGSIITLDDSDTGTLAQQGATRVIKLNNGRLQYNTSSRNNDSILYNTISTPRGGQYHVILPDGSKVWLNAASSLRFPTAFAGNERKVQLKGEAYFEIAHNKTMPFQVQVNDMKVEVLGTHFNVMGYANESTVNTTLLEGSVKIVTKQSVILKPGEQAILTHDSRLTIDAHTDTESVIAWKNGLFQFNSADIQTIMRQIERWYDVSVQYKGPIPEGHYSGIVPRANNLLKVLKILEASDLKFSIEGKTLFVL